MDQSCQEVPRYLHQPARRHPAECGHHHLPGPVHGRVPGGDGADVAAGVQRPRTSLHHRVRHEGHLGGPHHHQGVEHPRTAHRPLLCAERGHGPQQSQMVGPVEKKILLISRIELSTLWLLMKQLHHCFFMEKIYCRYRESNSQLIERNYRKVETSKEFWYTP